MRTHLAEHVASFRIGNELAPVLVGPKLRRVTQDPDRGARSRQSDVHSAAAGGRISALHLAGEGAKRERNLPSVCQESDAFVGGSTSHAGENDDVFLLTLETLRKTVENSGQTRASTGLQIRRRTSTVLNAILVRISSPYRWRKTRLSSPT